MESGIGSIREENVHTVPISVTQEAQTTGIGVSLIDFVFWLVMTAQWCVTGKPEVRRKNGGSAAIQFYPLMHVIRWHDQKEPNNHM
eukprot:scaffold38918_cov176-Amphora_coffeaeformis.AAC.3